MMEKFKDSKKSIFSHWKDDVRCVFERDPAARTRLEIFLTYPGVQAIMIHRISYWLWSRGWRFFPRFLSYLSRLISNVDIHPGAKIGERFFIDHGACVVIGETSIIGDDVTVYHGVTLGGSSWKKGRRHPFIGNGVMIGAGAKIIGSIQVGDQVRVGANSVVVNDVPSQCTVVGIPGKIVKVREVGQLNKYGIDLDHHLIPDPVGKAISCLLSRMDSLEKQLQEKESLPHNYQTLMFNECEVDNQICESDCVGSK